MELINCHDDLIIYIASYLDNSSVGSIFQCASKFYKLSFHERLWQIKLINEYGKNSLIISKKIQFVSYKDSYKLYFFTDYKVSIIFKELESCPYLIPEELKYYMIDAVIITGPEISSDLIWKQLQESPYDLPEDLKQYIDSAILSSQSNEEDLELEKAEKELKESIELLTQIQERIVYLTDMTERLRNSKRK